MNEPLLRSLGITRADIRRALGIGRSAVSMKVNGHRPWLQVEINAVLELARAKDGSVTYEQLFGDERDGQEPAA